MRIRGKVTLTVQRQADQVKELGGLSEILLIDRGVVAGRGGSGRRRIRA